MQAGALFGESEAVLTPDHRAPVYVEPDGNGGQRVVYRASALGMCSNALVMARQGREPDPHTAAASTVMNEGLLHEQAVLRVLEERFHVLGRGQTMLELLVSTGPTVLIRGHPDEVIRDPETGEEFVVEIKSMSDAAFKKWQRNQFRDFIGYAWQTSFYMLATNLPLLMAVKNRNSGEITLLWMHKPWFSEDALHERVLDIEHRAATSRAMPVCEQTDIWRCPYSSAHAGKVYSVGVDRTEDIMLDALVTAYENARTERIRWDAEVKECRDEIIRRMEDDLEARTQDWKITRRLSIYRRPDWDRVKQVLGKQFAELQTEQEQETLIVTRRKGAADG